MSAFDDARTLEKLTNTQLAAEDLWPVFDASTNKVKAITEAERSFNDPYDGEPVNHVAAVKATATYTGAGAAGSLALAAATGGDVALSLDLVDPGEASQSLSVVDGDGVVTVNLATDAGDNSSVTVGSGNGELTVTAPDSGGYNLVITDSGSGGILTASFFESTLTVSLAADIGTAAEWTITDAGTGADSLITATGPSGSGVDPTNFDAVTFESKIPSEAGASAIVVDETEWPNVIIWLKTDANGDVIPSTCADVATALGSAAGTNFIGADWTFVPDAAAGNWDSYNAPQTASTPAVPYAILTDGSNSATNVAAAIEAATDFTATAGGTGADDVVAQSASFTGGGLNAAITTTLSQLKTALNASSALIDAGAISNGTTLCTDTTISLTGGADEIPGTPAKLGRIATDGTDVWTALTDDPTTTQAGWVKTFTAAP